ncbi:DUF3788 family protein [Chitinophagaceae bacterium MMS25-I14]
MDKSIFTDKKTIPDAVALLHSLGNTYTLWQEIAAYVCHAYPQAADEWSYSGNGWSFRIKDKKRVIIYLLPRDGFFKVALVFGQKATDAIMKSNVAQEIKAELGAAKVYAEGRGIRIDIKNARMLDDIKELVDIKLAN